MDASIAEKRKECEKIFNSLEYPKEKEEEWRYTDLSKIKIESLKCKDAKLGFSHEGEVSAYLIEQAPQELVDKYAYTDVKKDKIESMNAAFWKTGFFVLARKNTKSLVNINASPGMLRNVIVAEPGSELVVVEELTGGSGLNNSVTSVFALPGSKIDYTIFQNFSDKVHDFSVKRAFMERDSAIKWSFCSIGSAFTRTRIDTIFNGAGSAAESIGVFLGRKNQHIDVTTNAYHNVPNTANTIDTKGVIKDKASSVFRGVIRIEKGCHGTNSYMSSHALKLSAESIANTIPSLFIDANDVKASHGATVGQIDDDQLFYLKSRGLSQSQAESMIIEGFFEPILKKLLYEDFKKRVLDAISGF